MSDQRDTISRAILPLPDRQHVALTKPLIGATLCVALLVLHATSAAAQAVTPASPEPTDRWAIVVAPYLVAAGMSGTVGIKDYDTVIDMSASDVLSNLKAGFMGYVGAKKNAWGIGLDAIYMRLGTSVTQGSVSIEPGVKQGAYTILASRRISRVADLVFGARINNITTTLAFTAPIVPDVSDHKTWVDPVAGVSILIPAGKRVKVGLLADLGGFGAASTIAVDLFPAVQLSVASHARLAFGYRYVYTDYDNEGFLYKVSVQGPVFGLVIPF